MYALVKLKENIKSGSSDISSAGGCVNKSIDTKPLIQNYHNMKIKN